MHSSGTADVCIRRGQCQPLGGKSVWASLGGSVNTTKPIVLVSATLDSNAFFHEVAIGADAHIASVIQLLLVAEALSKVDLSSLEKQIVLTAFAGESWGYLGSKKFVDDVTNFKCETLSEDGKSCMSPYQPSLEFEKIKLANIDLLVELDQVGNLGNVFLEFLVTFF
jgi:nicastrin